MWPHHGATCTESEMTLLPEACSGSWWTGKNHRSVSAKLGTTVGELQGAVDVIGRMWPILEKVSCVAGKNVYCITLLLGGTLYISIKYICSRILFNFFYLFVNLF